MWSADRRASVGASFLGRTGRRSISPFDRLPHALARFGGIGAILGLAHLLGELVVLDRLAHPARIVMALQVMQPRLVLHAVRHLQENHQVLGAKVERAGRPAEIEAFVLAKLALGIFAGVTLGLLGRRMKRNDFRRFAPCPAPDKSLTA